MLEQLDIFSASFVFSGSLPLSLHLFFSLFHLCYPLLCQCGYVSVYFLFFVLCFLYLPLLSLCPNFSVFLLALQSAHKHTHNRCRISILLYLHAELLLQCFCTRFFTLFNHQKQRNVKKEMLKLLFK